MIIRDAERRIQLAHVSLKAVSSCLLAMRCTLVELHDAHATAVFTMHSAAAMAAGHCPP